MEQKQLLIIYAYLKASFAVSLSEIIFSPIWSRNTNFEPAALRLGQYPLRDNALFTCMKES